MPYADPAKQRAAKRARRCRQRDRQRELTEARQRRFTVLVVPNGVKELATQCCPERARLDADLERDDQRRRWCRSGVVGPEC